MPQLPVLVANEVNQAGACLLLIYFSVNDTFDQQDVFQPDASWQPSRLQIVEAATEALLRYMLATHSRSALMLFEGTCISNETRVHTRES